MLITNETVAEHYFWLNIPFVYRIHETPSPEKMQELGKFVSTFGYTIKGDLEEVHPKALQSIISAIKGKKEEEAISTIMLRSLKQARYSPECSGHFGLAAQYYSHFTSPIRRYPDLQIHRIMKEHLNNKINKKKKIRPVMIVLFAFSIYFVYTFIEQQVQINKYDSEIEMYTADIENKRELVNYYNNQKGNTKSDEYIENVARESLGYVKPYEKIFIDANK